MITPRGRLFDIQHYAVHDGPGIRTIVFFKGCPLRCAWCCNPESHIAATELRLVEFKCAACGNCLAACPSGSIALLENGRVRIDRMACRDCGAPCVDACPIGALKRVGFDATVEDVVARVCADSDFYRNSGGGVTLSGGEPLAQPRFLTELLEKLRERDLHVALETSGYAPMATFASMAPLVDLFLFDVKIVDPARHEAMTGKSNAPILANLAAVAAMRPKDVIARLALVPGCNDDDENLDAIAALMKRLGLSRIDLNAYHPMGREKYEALGRDYPCDADPRVADDDYLARHLERFRRDGFEAELA